MHGAGTAAVVKSTTAASVPNSSARMDATKEDTALPAGYAAAPCLKLCHSHSPYVGSWCRPGEYCQDLWTEAFVDFAAGNVKLTADVGITASATQTTILVREFVRTQVSQLSSTFEHLLSRIRLYDTAAE